MHADEPQADRAKSQAATGGRRSYVPPTVEDLGTINSLTGARIRPSLKTTLGAEDIAKT